MEARVKATGEIVEVVSNGLYYESIKDERIFDKCELEIISKTKTLDYWTRLEHQAAIAAMQAIISKQTVGHKLNTITDLCCDIAHALVEKLKEKEE